MRKILRFDTGSIAKPFAVLYAIFGMLFAVAANFQPIDRITVPIGLLLPNIYLTINLHLLASHSLSPWAIFLILISMVCYAFTGAISGATVAIVYNRTSHLWRGIEGLPEGTAPETPKPPDYEGPAVV